MQSPYSPGQPPSFSSLVGHHFESIELAQWIILRRYWAGMWNIGTLAGEVGNPRRDFPRAIAVLIPLVFAMTVFPLATSVSIDHDLLKYGLLLSTPPLQN